MSIMDFMEKTLKHINSMVDQGIIVKYAIGGGIANLYYLESTITWDLDVMVILPSCQKIPDSSKKIYDWAAAKNFPCNKYIKIEGIPVLFTPAYNALVKEAIEQAMKINILNTDTYVLIPEYLIAIMLQSGRDKDKLIVKQFYEKMDFDKYLLDQLLEKYSLKSKLIFPENYLSNKMDNQLVTRIFESKKAFHKKRNQDPFEEKLRQLVQLQALRLEIKKSKGEPVKFHEVVWPV